jgi:hypothetical protein
MSYPILLRVAQRSRTVLCRPNTEVVPSDPFRLIDLLCLRTLYLFMFFRESRVAQTSGVPRGVWGGSNPPPRNSEILTKYQKLRKFYYMK